MKAIFSQFYQNLFLANRLFYLVGSVALLFLISFFIPWLGDIPVILFWTVIILMLIDIWLLYRVKSGFLSRRSTPEKLSNGDENEISVFLENQYSFPIQAEIIDEIPHQFQKRDISFKASLKSKERKTITYNLRPTKRGVYEFGLIRVYVRSGLGLVIRRYNFESVKDLAVYPSFLHLRKYELLAISNRLSEYGIKKIRRLGNSMEFDQIKNYVSGDDFKNLNWKASARHGSLMVNSYIEEKSQHIYCVIDKSRLMKMPFDGLSLLDYSINACLVLSKVALVKEDKVGLITISDKSGAIISADKKATQLNKFLEVLYKEKTRYMETNMELLYNTIRRTLKQRSLVVYFTNFESLNGLERQLPYLKRISKFHLLIIVFFENIELKALSKKNANDVEEIYIKTVAEKFIHEKKLIVKELSRHGIQSILTSPQNLTVNALNKYIEIKAQQKI